MAAKNAGVFDVLVDRGEHLPDVEASLTIESLEELEHLLK